MPPNPTPRKPSYSIPSADTELTSSSSFPSSSSSGLFSPPPRPPKPTNKDGAGDPALPPALPPKMKQEAPALPPKPSKSEYWKRRNRERGAPFIHLVIFF